MPGVSRAPLLASHMPANSPEGSGESGVMSAPRMSTMLWGVDLNKGLPRVLSNDGVVAVAGELARVRNFLAAEFPWFGEETLGAELHAHIVSAKQCYLRTACDLIELQHRERTVGVLVGAPEDWSTYYVRMFAIVQSYQRPSMTRRFVRECLFDPLGAHHVERVVGDTSPANLGMARLFNELHFHVTGNQLSDRWGPLIRYTRFLDPAREVAFLKRYPGIIAGGGTRMRKEEPP